MHEVVPCKVKVTHTSIISIWRQSVCMYTNCMHEFGRGVWREEAVGVGGGGGELYIIIHIAIQ